MTQRVRAKTERKVNNDNRKPQSINQLAIMSLLRQKLRSLRSTLGFRSHDEISSESSQRALSTPASLTVTRPFTTVGSDIDSPQQTYDRGCHGISSISLSELPSMWDAESGESMKSPSFPSFPFLDTREKRSGSMIISSPGSPGSTPSISPRSSLFESSCDKDDLSESEIRGETNLRPFSQLDLPKENLSLDRLFDWLEGWFSLVRTTPVGFMNALETDPDLLIERNLYWFFNVYQIVVSPSELAQFLIDRTIISRSKVVKTKSQDLVLPGSTEDLFGFSIQPDTSDSDHAFLPSFFLYWVRKDPRLPQLLPLVDQLSVELMQTYPAAKVHLTAAVQQFKTECFNLSMYSRPSFDISDGSGQHPIRSGFSKLPPREAAFMLACSHAYFLKSLSSHEVFDVVVSKIPSDACAAVATHFNSVVRWIQTICLKSGSHTALAASIEFWVTVANAAYQTSLFNTLFIVISALSGSSISRLKQTWANISLDIKSQWEVLNNLCCPKSNFRQFRMLVEKTHDPLPLVIIQKDLTGAAEVTALNDISKESIPIANLRYLGTLIPSYFELSGSSMFVSADLLEFLKDPLPRSCDDNLFALSYTLEPPRNRGLCLDTHDITEVVNPLLVRTPHSSPALRALSPAKDSTKRNSTRF